MNEKTQEIDPHLLEVEEIKKALTLLEVASYNEAELMEYDKCWDVISSEKTLLIGKFAAGKAAGRAEGRAEGEMKAKMEMVKKMYSSHLPINEIASFTGLSHEEIENILQST